MGLDGRRRGRIRLCAGLVEYDYLGFGSDVATLKCTMVADCGPPGKGAIDISIRENFHMLKTGVNFHF